MLRLIVSNSEPSSKPVFQPLSPPIDRASFSSDVKLKGPNLHVMTVQDPGHYMNGELVLEVEESQCEYGNGSVICHFPSFDTQELNNFICEDETLYGIIMIQFQMKIMEQLLLFCATHYASKLVIFADDILADEFEIYREFLSSRESTLAQNEKAEELTIPSNSQIYDEWIEFMDDVTLKFRQTLWQDQRTNPIVRQYLKIYPFG